jgi:2-keto-4-pentenoate hydratase
MSGRVNRAARSILEARRTGALLDALAPNDQPRSLEEGYAIQQVVTAEWPDRIAGWKVGATSKEVQTLFEVTEPIYGPYFKVRCFKARRRYRPGFFNTDCSNPSSSSGSERTSPAGHDHTLAAKSSMRSTL